jgi:hypothetical protein
MLSDRNRRQVEQTQPTPCACDGDRFCLLHYHQLSPDRRATARAGGGIRDPQHKHRTAWAGR